MLKAASFLFYHRDHHYHHHSVSIRGQADGGYCERSFNCAMSFTAGFSAKLSNLVLQLPEQQKSFDSYLAHYPFLHIVFTSVRTVANNFPLALSCPSVRLLQRGTHWTDFREICYLRPLLKICRDDQESLTFEQTDLPPCTGT